MTDSACVGDRVSFSPKATLRGTIGSALASIGRSWDDVEGIVLHVEYRSNDANLVHGAFDGDQGLVRVAAQFVPSTLDTEWEVPWDAGWAPGGQETRKFAATLWLPGLILRFAPGLGMGEGVVCEAFSTAAPTQALDAVVGRAAPRGATAPEHTVADGLRVLRSIARQLGSEDDKDSERCIVDAVGIVEEALAAGRLGVPPKPGANPTYFIEKIWSARRSADGTRLEPGERISGVDIMTEAYGPMADAEARHWLESLGRIANDAAIFVEAPFRLVPAVETEATKPKPTEGEAE